MGFTPDLRLLLARGDAGATAQVSRAVAQLSAHCRVDLTVAHVAAGDDADGVSGAPLTFPPDAAPCRIQRLELPGDDAAVAIARLCARQSFDMVMAPAGPASWLPRMWRRSFRARLLGRVAVPLWTAGPPLASMPFERPIHTVACMLDFDVDPEPLLHRTAAFARRMGAQLHVLGVLPPVDDGTLATVLTSETPLLPATALDRIEQMCAGRATPVVDVVVDGVRRGLTRLLRRCHPDLLFVAAGQWASVWPLGFPRTLDALACPVVCVPTTAETPGWSFERPVAYLPVAAGAERATSAARSRVGAWPAEGVASRAL